MSSPIADRARARLRDLLREGGISGQDLARRAALSPGAVSKQLALGGSDLRVGTLAHLCESAGFEIRVSIVKKR